MAASQLKHPDNLTVGSSHHARLSVSQTGTGKVVTSPFTQRSLSETVRISLVLFLI